MPLNLSKNQYEQLLNLLGSLQVEHGTTNNSENMLSGAVNLAGILVCYSSITEIGDLSCKCAKLTDDSWIIDSGASHHMTYNKTTLTNIRPLPSPFLISLPNGYKVKVTESGDVCLGPVLTLQKVLFVPSFKFNLISVHCLVFQLKGVASFNSVSCLLQGPSLKSPLELGRAKNEKEVSLHGKLYSAPLNLRLLRPEESWELLEKRAFGNESCPDDLLDVGKEIAENCKGLPLVADLIAGVIAGREKKKTVWLEVQNNLSSFILNSEVEVMKVIELSYDHLPHHIKPCLLYLASCPKDTALDISFLKAVWSAEGLVEQTEMKSVKEDLISSSLVIAFNEIGDYPTFQLHDLVHEFCLIKAREEKLFDQISSSTPSSSSDLMPRILTIDYDDDEEHFGLNFVLFRSNKKRHSGKHLYSLTIDGDEQLADSVADTFHLRHLRLLRVLNLDPSFINVNDSLLNEISMLNHLRFLRIGTQVKYLPLSFSNLWNLETLVVQNNGTTLILLPRIWDLVKLRRLCVSNCSFFDMDADESILIAEDTKLEKLKILVGLILSYSKDTEDIFKWFPNLQLLQFDLKESWDYSTEQYWFPKLDCLTELEDLTVGFNSSNTNDSGSSAAINRPWNFYFPLNLKKLCLVDFPLTSNSLYTIARLPNLEELYLDRTIIHGEEWNMGEEDTFENLKFFKLDEMTLSKWEVGEESFPSLEKSELEECRKLEEIPPSFGDISSLKIIKLVKSPQLEDSALKIKEYAEDMRGGDELQVVGRKNILLFK
ncbi:putative late blight resistance protein homolog R1B-16 [Solanum stenotomum]|uniref:putative late blight resistance protein homolog R1B-16 n=1 Tax=Solanum stenotomum TaxID=172797 RepID=UPI0020D045A0|nr:putative late blight resistance protein homolog R1B-16 [Solanum stenotomum]